MPGGNSHRHYSKPSTSTTASVSNPPASFPPSDLPLDIIPFILKRLPVKSILRFKCVSKDWLSLLSDPKFISIHREETSNNPLNHSFIILSWNKDDLQELSLLNVNSTERMPVSLFNPFYGMLKQMELVGSINGLVCLPCRKGLMVILWNPAMNLYKPIRLSILDEDTSYIMLGFAYDSVNDDYEIIQIDCLKPSRERLLSSRAKAYSASLDSWKRIQLNFPSLTYHAEPIVIAKGIPYCIADIYEANNQCRVLVYYDMQNGSFKHAPLPDQNIGFFEPFVEWKGNLGRIVSRAGFVDIWVYDEMGVCWNKISSHGPIGLNAWVPMQCSRDGLILGDTDGGILMVYDPETNRIKEFSIPGALEDLFEAVSYTESLVTINGMEKVEE